MMKLGREPDPRGPADPLARISSARIRVSLGQSAIRRKPWRRRRQHCGRLRAWAAPAYQGGNLGTHIFNGAIYALGYDDFEAIIASDATPANNRRQLLAWLKSNSGRHAAPLVAPRISPPRFP
jgi:hypothetical protein